MLRLFTAILGLFDLVHDLFGWPGVAVLGALIAVGVFALLRYGGDMFRWLLFRNFKAHGKILQGAKVEVHSVTPAPEPAKEPEDAEFEDMLDEADVPDDDGSDMHYYYLDVTITTTKDPKSLEHPEDGWDPVMLMLVEAGRKNVELMEIDGAAFVQDGWIMRGQQWVMFGGPTCHGPARIKLHIALRPDCPRLQFLYMQEVFGDIVIPGVATTLAPQR